MSRDIQARRFARSQQSYREGVRSLKEGVEGYLSEKEAYEQRLTTWKKKYEPYLTKRGRSEEFRRKYSPRFVAKLKGEYKETVSELTQKGQQLSQKYKDLKQSEEQLKQKRKEIQEQAVKLERVSGGVEGVSPITYEESTPYGTKKYFVGGEGQLAGVEDPLTQQSRLATAEDVLAFGASKYRAARYAKEAEGMQSIYEPTLLEKTERAILSTEEGRRLFTPTGKPTPDPFFTQTVRDYPKTFKKVERAVAGAETKAWQSVLSTREGKKLFTDESGRVADPTLITPSLFRWSEGITGMATTGYGLLSTRPSQTEQAFKEGGGIIGGVKQQAKEFAVDPIGAAGKLTTELALTGRVVEPVVKPIVRGVARVKTGRGEILIAKEDVAILKGAKQKAFEGIGRITTKEASRVTPTETVWTFPKGKTIEVPRGEFVVVQPKVLELPFTKPFMRTGQPLTIGLKPSARAGRVKTDLVTKAVPDKPGKAIITGKTTVEYSDKPITMSVPRKGVSIRYKKGETLSPLRYAERQQTKGELGKIQFEYLDKNTVGLYNRKGNILLSKEYITEGVRGRIIAREMGLSPDRVLAHELIHHQIGKKWWGHPEQLVLAGESAWAKGIYKFRQPSKLLLDTRLSPKKVKLDLIKYKPKKSRYKIEATSESVPQSFILGAKKLDQFKIVGDVKKEIYGGKKFAKKGMRIESILTKEKPRLTPKQRLELIRTGRTRKTETFRTDTTTAKQYYVREPQPIGKSALTIEQMYGDVPKRLKGKYTSGRLIVERKGFDIKPDAPRVKAFRQKEEYWGRGRTRQIQQQNIFETDVLKTAGGVGQVQRAIIKESAVRIPTRTQPLLGEIKIGFAIQKEDTRIGLIPRLEQRRSLGLRMEQKTQPRFATKTMLEPKLVSQPKIISQPKLGLQPKLTTKTKLRQQLRLTTRTTTRTGQSFLIKPPALVPPIKIPKIFMPFGEKEKKVKPLKKLKIGKGGRDPKYAPSLIAVSQKIITKKKQLPVTSGLPIRPMQR